MACALCAPELQTPVLRESRHWRTALNRNQNLLGKTIVVLRRHEEAVAALSADEWTELQGVHLHVIPRYAGSRVVGNVTFDDSAYPNHYRPGEERRLGREQIDAIAAAVAEPV